MKLATLKGLILILCFKHFFAYSLTNQIKWGEWSDWSEECNQLCAPDSKIHETRHRQCLSKFPCKGDREESRTCSHLTSYGCYSEHEFSITQCGTRLSSLSQLPDPIPEKVNSFSKRIINGYPTKSVEYPWLVQMVAYGGYVICTGALISPWCVLTAGHCFDDGDLDYVLYAGKYHTDVDVQDMSAQKLKMRSYEVHPDYDFDTADNDYAVIILEEPVTVNAFVKPLCLPDAKEELSSDSFCFVAGWGITVYDTFEYPEELLELLMPILSPEVCDAVYNKEKSYFTDNMICAGYLHSEGDSCQGDSGAPLVCKRKDGSFFVAGLVSWGNGCAKSGFPGVYSKVSNGLDWIMASMPDKL